LSVRKSLRRSATDLSKLGRRAAIVGGLAVGSRAEPRFTRDVDLAVTVFDDADAERLVHALLQRGYGVLKTVEHRAMRRLAAVRLAPPADSGGRAIVDLLFASSGIEAEIAAASEPMAVFPRIAFPVARVGHLVAMKLLSRSEARPLDHADLIALRGELDVEETARAREAVRLIEARGYARGRDLVRDLEEYLVKRP
jgi:hypothetical protein